MNISPRSLSVSIRCTLVFALCVLTPVARAGDPLVEGAWSGPYDYSSLAGIDDFEIYALTLLPNTPGLEGHVLFWRDLSFSEAAIPSSTTTFLVDPDSPATASYTFNESTHEIGCSGLVLLPSGLFLAIAGHSPSAGCDPSQLPASPTVSVYGLNAVNPRWRAGVDLGIPDMAVCRHYPNAFYLPGSRVMVMGGDRDDYPTNIGCGGSQCSTYEILTIETPVSSWSAPRYAPPAFKAHNNPFGHVLVVDDFEGVFFMGASSTATGLDPIPSYCYDPAVNTWTELGDGGARTASRFLGMSLLQYRLDGAGGSDAHVFAVGGCCKPPDPDGCNHNEGQTSIEWTVNPHPTTPATWSSAELLTSRVYGDVLSLPDGRILFIGGLTRPTFQHVGPKVDCRVDYPGGVFKGEIFDPETGLSEYVAMQTSVRAYHSAAILLPDGSVMSAGGEFTEPGSPGYGGMDVEMFDPPYMFAPRPAILQTVPREREALEYDSVLLVDVELPANVDVAKVTLTRSSSSTHQVDSEQRYVELEFNEQAFEPPTPTVTPNPGPSPTSGASSDQLKTAGVAGSHLRRLAVQLPDTPWVAPPGFYMLWVVSDDGGISESVFVQLCEDGNCP